jgi:hypothetical protein
VPSRHRSRMGREESHAVSLSWSRRKVFHLLRRSSENRRNSSMASCSSQQRETTTVTRSPASSHQSMSPTSGSSTETADLHSPFRQPRGHSVESPVNQTVVSRTESSKASTPAKQLQQNPACKQLQAIGQLHQREAAASFSGLCPAASQLSVSLVRRSKSKYRTFSRRNCSLPRGQLQLSRAVASEASTRLEPVQSSFRAGLEPVLSLSRARPELVLSPPRARPEPVQSSP